LQQILGKADFASAPIISLDLITIVLSRRVLSVEVPVAGLLFHLVVIDVFPDLDVRRKNLRGIIPFCCATMVTPGTRRSLTMPAGVSSLQRFTGTSVPLVDKPLAMRVPVKSP
jgi:hypothetical protein